MARSTSERPPPSTTRSRSAEPRRPVCKSSAWRSGARTTSSAPRPSWRTRASVSRRCRGRRTALRDPDGNAVELYWGDDKVSEDYGDRNVKPLNLSHVVIRTTDVDRAYAFYKDVFGFKESDWNGHHMVFLRCNEVHHQLAFVARTKAGLDHVAFEVNDFMDIAKGVFYLGDKGVPRLWGPGRHGAGNNLFSYFWDPEQNIIEYTTDLIRIYDDSTWTPRVWPGRDTIDLWKQGPPPVMRE